MGLVDDILKDHLLPLFEGFELAPIVDGNSSPPDQLLTGRVELHSERVTGSVGVCGSLATIEGTAPFGGIDPRDWVGELANLAAGRLKYGALSLAQLRLKQSTPEVIGGEGLPAAGNATRVIKLRGDGGTLRVWLELDGLEDISALGPMASSTRVRAMPAGQSLFFD